MTMRAALERNVAIGTDPHGNPVAPDFQPLASLPCFVWSTRSREAVNAERRASVEDLRAGFPLGSDIQADDEIASVTDRIGLPVVSGRLRIEGPVQRKHTHLEVGLRRIA